MSFFFFFMYAEPKQWHIKNRIPRPNSTHLLVQETSFSHSKQPRLIILIFSKYFSINRSQEQVVQGLPQAWTICCLRMAFGHAVQPSLQISIRPTHPPSPSQPPPSQTVLVPLFPKQNFHKSTKHGRWSPAKDAVGLSHEWTNSWPQFCFLEFLAHMRVHVGRWNSVVDSWHSPPNRWTRSWLLGKLEPPSMQNGWETKHLLICHS